jgi:hypothetical protein
MSHCPDDEILAGFLEDRLDPAAREAVEEHVAACATCLDVVAAALPSSEAAVPAADLPSSAAPTPRVHEMRPRRARALGRGFAIAAMLTLVVGGSAGYFGGRLAIDAAREALARRVTEQLGVPIAIGGIGASVDADLRTIAIRLVDLRLGALDTIGAIEARVPLASLTSATPPIERIRLERPFFHIRTDETLADAGTPLAIAAAAPAIELIDGTFLLELPGEAPLRIEGLSGTTTPRGERTDITLAGRSAGGRVSLRGTVAGDPRPSVHLRIGGTGLAADAIPQLRASGRVDLTLDVDGTPAAPRVAGRALLTDGRFVDWNPLAAVAARAAALAPAASLPVGGALDVDSLRLVFAVRDGRWRAPRVRLERAGLVVSAALRGDTAGHVSGHGVGQLPPASPAGVTPPEGAAPTADALAVPFTVGGTLAAPVVTPTR